MKERVRAGKKIVDFADKGKQYTKAFERHVLCHELENRLCENPLFTQSIYNTTTTKISWGP